MKWTVSIDGDTGDATVSDHNGSEIATLGKEGGHQIPGDVLDVMFDSALAEYRDGNVEEALTIVAMMAGEQIEVEN